MLQAPSIKPSASFWMSGTLMGAMGVLEGCGFGFGRLDVFDGGVHEKFSESCNGGGNSFGRERAVEMGSTKNAKHRPAALDSPSSCHLGVLWWDAAHLVKLLRARGGIR